MIPIAIDCMGGDHGLSVTIPAAVKVAKLRPQVKFLAVGDSQLITAALSSQPQDVLERFEIIHASEVVAMDDTVEVALRRRRDSSMRVALNLVKEGKALACVSAGNTGALMAVARYVLKTLNGIDRPAICTGLPQKLGGKTNVLDLGANIDCTATHLLQFAIMGVAKSKAVDGLENPTVGLLNVGTEEIKGGETVKNAAELLRQSGLNFVGFVEGNDIFTGKVDVVVCDGFVGNSVLKAVEGAVRLIASTLKEEYKRGWWSKLAALFSMGVISRLRKRLDNRSYNGAMLLGLNGIVVKSHGSADIFSFSCALDNAIEAASHKMLDQIGSVLNEISTRDDVAHNGEKVETLKEQKV
ncbi:phosphate acyltransferase PlsX [Basilea psittacipulmonis]|uniref:Phosphate acyltransferase n=1 Tax=Basilea psittacipulmonis DSM 24701 TaxID=1072685 RepID=A0A077DIF4_9BURK|nr:phosphate acyltransferase PlsX [Basilea psittacipulmonis]AIL33252.1 phosphate acyltransferase [Basilea psittacipulmonis DSM 24701]